MMRSDPSSATTASGRSSPCVSEMTPMNIGTSALCLCFCIGSHQLIHLGMSRRPFHLLISTGGLQLLRNSAQQSHGCPHRAGAEANALHTHLHQLWDGG